MQHNWCGLYTYMASSGHSGQRIGNIMSPNNDQLTLPTFRFENTHQNGCRQH